MRLPNLLATKAGRLTAFFFLYVTEGIPLGFTATAVATQMRRQGVTPSQIGIFVGTLYLPWAWKWAVGPVVDTLYSNRLGRRRAWIVAMQVLMVGTLLAAMPVDFTAEIKLFTLIIIVMNCFGAVQDVAIDALACGVLREEERGLANGLMFAGAYAGQAVGGSGVLFLAEFTGFNSTFFFVVTAILSVTVFIALPLREKPSPHPDSAGRARLKVIRDEIADYVRTAFRAFFGTRRAVLGLVFALLPAGAYALSLPLATNLAVELGLSDSQISLLTFICTIISAACCVLGGWLSDRFDRRKVLAFYLAATAIPTLFLAVMMYDHGWIMPVDPTMPNRPVPPFQLLVIYWAVSLVFSVPQGLMYGTRTALFMDIANPEVAATQFTAYMAVLNLVIWYSATWQGLVIEKWGYPITLSLDAAVGLLCLVPLALMGGKRENGSDV